jgi:hypothetical protein
MLATQRLKKYALLLVQNKVKDCGNDFFFCDEQKKGTSRLLASARKYAIGGSVARAALAFTKGVNNGPLEAAVGLAMAEKGAHTGAITKSLTTLQTVVLQQKGTRQRLEDLCKALVRACVQPETDLMNAAMEEAIGEQGVSCGQLPARLAELPNLGEGSIKTALDAELRWSAPADLLEVALVGEKLQEVMLTSLLWAEEESFLDMLLKYSSSPNFKQAVMSWLFFFPHVLGKDSIRSKLKLFCPEALKPALAKHTKSESFLPSSRSFSAITPAKVPLERLLLSFPAAEWAKQMCLADAEMFAKIQPCELLNGVWTKPKLRYICSNLMAFINHSNAVSLFVSSSILLQERQPDRARAYSQVFF